MRKRLRFTILLGASLTLSVCPALAVEGALGRTVPGIWVMPRAGVIGPAPGASFTMMPIGYMGTLSGTHQVPVAGTIFTDLSGDTSVNYLLPQYVYKTETTKLSLSSSFAAPVNWLSAGANVQTSNSVFQRQNANAGLADVFFSPLTVGIHFTETNHLAVSTMIFAPTGSFVPGNLSNTGMGEWTIMPNIAHTLIWQKHRLELDNFVGFDIYSQNRQTRYTSGTVFHWDGMLVKYLSDRFGFGAIVSNVTQITNDTGPLADLLHGFEGRAWGAGPMALYVARPKNPGVTVQIRWVPEFAVTNLLQGNTLMVGLSVKFD
jgi:hypothetical protein